MSCKIVTNGRLIEEFTIDGKPVELKRLLAVNLKMVAAKKTVLTLEYHVDDIEIYESEEGEEIEEVTYI